MLSFLSWYILITILGWLTFPLAIRLFPMLADRGYSLSRAFGLLTWGYIFWLSASLGLAQNDMGGLLLGLVVLGGLSAWVLMNADPRPQTGSPLQQERAEGMVSGQQSAIQWIKENKKLVLTTEILFLVAFGFMAFVRAGNPEILGTEKPMELMFINGIMNSPTFPPRDLWLSGYSISYYYFGYVMTSMLAMFTGTPATAAFNLMIALIFGLSAVVAYGILYNLLSSKMDRPEPVEESKVEIQPETAYRKSPTLARGASAGVVNSLLAPLFLLLISNVEGFLDVLHTRGLFWREGSNFWTWLDLPELRDAPAQTASWIPERFWWWWRASRVVQDYELNGAFREVIDEFPFFSYLLGDLHPHVLSMPFVLLAIAVALNLFLGGWRGNINLYFGQLRISKSGFFVIALLLGGLAFLNTWDILVVAALIVFSYALAQIRESGWGWERLGDVLLLGIPAIVIGYVMYLPFFIGFDSQAGGIVPNFMFPTRGAHLWIMWGTLFVPVFAYLIYLIRTKMPADWRTGILTTLIFLLVLLAAMFIIGFIALKLKPDLINPILESQGLDTSAFIAKSFLVRLKYIGSLITLLALLIPALSFLFKFSRLGQTESPLPQESQGDVSRRAESEGSISDHPLSFILLLIVLGTLLILGPDFLYLRDNFGYRINTVFKFYYQAWILLSLASAYGTAVLLRHLSGAANRVFSVIFALMLIVGLTYPTLGVFTKTNKFKPFEYTLDDFDRVQRENPDEAAAMLWLQSAPDGIVAEAVGDAYSSYARIAIYTGLPTVLGWGNHEGQWREHALQGSRQPDIETLYSTPDWFTAQEIINQYDIRYVYIGNLERTTYSVNEEKFNSFLKLVFQQGNVAIYEVP